MFKVPEKYRITRAGPYSTTEADGNNGLFIIPKVGSRLFYFVIASDGLGWEHVSIHLENDHGKCATPNWDDMCAMKDLFWEPEDVVIQYHPKKSEYVSNHPNVLHLWRPTGQTIPTPPKIMVGI